MAAQKRALALWLVLCTLLPGQSEDIFQRVRRAFSDSGEAEAAITDLQSKHFASLEERLKRLKSANGAPPAETLALEGALAFLAGNMAEASAAFAASDKLQPLTEGDRFTHAMALVRLNNDSQARGILIALAREHAARSLYWYWLGRLDYDQRRYANAVENLQKATELDPDSARAWDSLGLAWDMQGQVASARPAFEKAVNLNRAQAQPSPWPPLNLGSLLVRSGETPAAEKFLRESLRYDATLGKTHYFLGRLLEKEGREQDAVLRYKDAVKLDSHAADACYALAMLYRKLHRDADAEEMFSEFRRRKQE